MYEALDYRVIEIARILAGRILDKEEKPLITYGELAKQLPYSISPRNLDGPLGTLSDICQYHGMPLLSTIVVNKDHSRPGDGYFKVFFQGKAENEWDQIFFEQLNKVENYKHWDKLLKVLHIER